MPSIRLTFTASAAPTLATGSGTYPAGARCTPLLFRGLVGVMNAHVCFPELSVRGSRSLHEPAPLFDQLVGSQTVQCEPTSV